MRTDWSPGFWQRLYATFVRNRLQSQAFHRARRRAMRGWTLRNSARTASWEMLEPRAMLAGDGFITQSSLVNPSFEAVDASVYTDWHTDVRGSVGWYNTLNTGAPWNAGSTATTAPAGNFDAIDGGSLTDSRYMRLASDGGSISGYYGSGAISQHLGRMEAGKTYTLTADVFGGNGNTGYEVVATLTSDLVGGTTFATATSAPLWAYEFSDGGSVVSHTATAQDAGRDLWITFATTQPGDGLARRGGIDDIQLVIADSQVVPQGPSAPSRPVVSTLVNGSFEQIFNGAGDPLYGGEPYTDIRDAAGWFHGVNTGAPWNTGSTYTTGDWGNYDGIDAASLDGDRYMRLVSDGGSIYGLNGYGAITQYLGQMEAGKTYTLTADVFGGNGNTGYEVVATLASSIVGGTTFATASIANVYAGQRNGSVVSYTATADDAGKDLWIKYSTTQPGDGLNRRGGIDNVRLAVTDSTPPPPPTPSGSLSFDLATLGATSQTATLRLSDDGSRLIVVSGATEVATVAYSNASINVALAARAGDTLILDLRSAASPPKANITISGPASGLSLVVLGRGIAPVNTAASPTAGTLGVNADTSIAYGGVSALTVVSVAAASDTVGSVVLRTGGGLVAGGDSFTALNGRLTAATAASSLVTVAGLSFYLPASGVAPAIGYDISQAAFLISGSAVAALGAGRVPVTLGSRGLVIENGALTAIDMTFNGTLASGGLVVGGATFTLAGLRVAQTVVNSTFTVTGATQATGISGILDTLTVRLGSAASATSPATTGLVVTNGAIASFDMAVTSTINLEGLSLAPTAVAATLDAATGKILLTGTATASGITGAGSLAVQLGSVAAAAAGGLPALPATTGLVVAAGRIESCDMAVTAGTFTIDGLSLSTRGLKIARTAGGAYRMTGFAAFTPTSESEIQAALPETGGLSFVGVGGLTPSVSAITAFTMTVSQAFSVGGLAFAPLVAGSLAGLTIRENLATKSFTITGSAAVTATRLAATEIVLGGNQTAGLVIKDQAITSFVMQVASTFTAAAHAFTAGSGMTLSRSSGTGTSSQFVATGTATLTSQDRNWAVTLSGTAGSRLLVAGGAVTELGMAVAPGSVTTNSQQFNANVGSLAYTVVAATGVGRLTGTAQLTVLKLPLAVTIGATPSAGWTYTDGVADSTVMKTGADFAIGGISFGNSNLTIQGFTAPGFPATGLWRVTGAAKFGMGLFDAGVSITLGSDDDPSSGWLATQTSLSQLDFRIDAGFDFQLIKFTTTPGVGLRVRYTETLAVGSEPAHKTFTLTGGASAAIVMPGLSPMALSCTFGGIDPKTGKAVPGLVIQDGKLLYLDVLASFNANFGGVQILARDIHFVYDRAAKRYAFSGQAAAIIQGTEPNLAVTEYYRQCLGLPDVAPGVAIYGGVLLEFGQKGLPGIEVIAGRLERLDVAVSGSLGVKKVIFSLENMRFTYVANTKTFNLSGAAGVEFANRFALKVTFGYQTSPGVYAPGLTIVNGTLELLDMTVDSSLKIGAVELGTQGLRFRYVRDFKPSVPGAQSRFTMSGQIFATLYETQKVSLQFGSDDGTVAGIVVEEGKLTYVDAQIISGMEIGGFKLPLDARLGVVYYVEAKQVVIYGSAMVEMAPLFTMHTRMGGGSREEAIRTKDDPNAPGFVIVNGKLTKFEFEVTDVRGGPIQSGTMYAKWFPATSGSAARFELSGSSLIDSGIGVGTASFGTRANPGMIIEGKTLKKLDFEGYFSDNMPIIDLSANFRGLYDPQSGVFRMTGTAGLAIESIAIPEKWWAITLGKKETPRINVGQVSMVLNVNINNPRTDVSYFTAGVSLFGLPQVNATVKFGTPKIELDFSPWGDALKNAFKEVGKKIAAGFKKLFGKKGQIDGATIFYDPTGASIVNGVLTFEPSLYTHSTTKADGSTAVPIGEPSGRLVLFGGTDTSTTLSNNLVMIAPGDADTVTPYTTLLVNLLDNQDDTVATGSAKIREVFGLDEDFDLLSAPYLLDAIGGSEPAARAFRGDVKIVSLADMVTGSLAGLPNTVGAVPTKQSLGLFFCSSLAEAVHTAAQTDQQLDLADAATVRALIEATASRAGIALTDPAVAANVAAAADIAAGVMSRIDAATPAGSADYMTAIVKVQKLATGAIPEQFALVNAGTTTSAAVAAAFSGTALDTLIASQIVGNLDAPQVSISDPTVTLAADGSATLDFAVTIAGTSSPDLPISVAYMTQDSTATVADGDYDAVSGTLTWAPGDTSTKYVSVPVRAGNTPTASQFFLLDATATNAVVADIGAGQIDLAPLTTTTGLVVSSESGIPRNITVLEATILSAVAGDVPATGSVTFYDGDAVLGTVDLDLAGKAVWQSDLFLAGSHTFRAVYSGGTSQGYTFATSTSANQVVTVGTTQTISVDPIANRVWGIDDTTVQVMAGASSGMPVSYSISGPATIDEDGLVTTTGLGHVVVTVTQAGDAYTTAATPVVVSFDVARPTITVRIDSQTADYGDDLSALGLTYTLSGFLGDDSSASLAGLPVLSVAPGAVHPGTYAIGATTAADSKYDFQVEAGTLTIRKALLTVTVADKTVGYGASLPTLTYSIAGFVHGDTASVLDALPQLATTAAGSDAGSYDITAADVEDNDYEIVIVAGKLTITPAALTITADNQAITYGDALPTFTVRYSGFVNGDTAASLDTAASVAVATASFHAGSYGLTAADAFDPNYTISFVPGTLTVAKAALTISADSLTQVAGRPQPTLTATFSGFVNGETSAVLTTQPQLSTDSDGSVGTAATSVSGASSDDYQISYQAGTITVVADTPSFAVLSSIAAPLAGNTPTYTVTIVSGFDGQAIAGGTVQFRLDGVDQGSPVSVDENGTASFTAAPLVAGSHTITAVYSGTTGIEAGTQSLAQSVGQYAATTTFVSAVVAATYGETPTYTVRVTPTDVSNGTPQGTVQFVVDGIDVGTPVTVDGSGEATSPALAVLGAGTHTVLARFTSSNGFQSGADSVVLSVARKTIAITGLSGVNKTYDGTTAATVSGAATYDGLVTGESFGVVGSGTATFADANAGVGKTVTVTGYESPSDNYELTASPTVTATILAKAITITGLTGVDRTYDGTTAATVSGTAVYDGLVNGESFSVVGSGTATFVDANAGVGKSVTIAGYAAPGGNYVLPANPSVTATISPARLTVRANNSTRPYGAANPGNLTAVITGFVAAETTAVVSGTPAFIVSASATSPVSASGYAITPTAGSLTAKNYLFDTFQAGSLVVTKAALTVAAVAATKVSGSADPSFIFTVGGLVAGNTVATALSGSLTRDAGESAGSYTIRQGSLGLTASAAASYDLTFQPATFTILAAPRLVVSGGFVKGSTWNTGYLAVPAFTTTAAGSQLGQPLTDGSGQLAAAAALTWTNVNVVSLRFNEAVSAPAATSLVIRGVTGSGVGVQSVITSSAVAVLDGGTVVQWTLPQSLRSGKYEMTIADNAIRTVAGSRALDGEWTTGSTTFGSGSGNGTAGGAFVYRFSVLAGDINASGTVAADDQTTTQAGRGQPFSAANYRLNVNGDTGINAVDTSLVSLEKGKTTLSSLGAFVPPLTAAVGVSVDAAFSVTFPDDPAWRAAITGIKVGSTATNGVLLPAGAYTISAGRITFTPAAAALLQTSGTKVFAVVATGYADDAVTQAISVGAARALAIGTQPVGPAANGGLLRTMPVVRIVDQYGNTVTGSALTVVATVETGTGSWSLSGGTSVAATRGVATFSTLRATSVGGAARARIRFTCGALSTILSNEFAVPAV